MKNLLFSFATLLFIAYGNTITEECESFETLVFKKQ